MQVPVRAGRSISDQWWKLVFLHQPAKLNCLVRHSAVWQKQQLHQDFKEKTWCDEIQQFLLPSNWNGGNICTLPYTSIICCLVDFEFIVVVYRSNFKKVSLLKYLWIRLHPPTLSVCVCVRLVLSLQSTKSTLIVSGNTFNNVNKVNNVRYNNVSIMCFVYVSAKAETYTKIHTTNFYKWLHSNLSQCRELAQSVAVSNNKQLAMSMSSLHMKVLNWFAVGSPFNHVRIVQIDLHKVLLLGVVAIERPMRQKYNL